jgi:hypothetical protein
MDSNSAGGTFVNGQKVTQHELKVGDVFQAGDTQLRRIAAADQEWRVLGQVERAALIRAGHLAGPGAFDSRAAPAAPCCFMQV